MLIYCIKTKLKNFTISGEDINAVVPYTQLYFGDVCFCRFTTFMKISSIVKQQCVHINCSFIMTIFIKEQFILLKNFNLP